MTVNENLAEYDFSKCPFNSNHTFATQKYFSHISRCKDGLKIKHLYKNCQFNPLHIFLFDHVWEHQITCPERFDSLKKTDALKEAITNQNMTNEAEKIKVQEETKKYRGNIILQDCKDECLHILKFFEQNVEKLSEEKRNKLRRLLQSYDILWQKEEKLNKKCTDLKNQAQ